MKHNLTTMLALLLAIALYGNAKDIELMDANARYMADHPAISKIATRSQWKMVPVRKPLCQPDFNKPAFGPEHAALPEIWCNVVDADSWTGRYSAYGAYMFNPSNNFSLSMLHSGNSENMQGNGGAVKIGNKYHLTYWYMGIGTIMSKYYVWNTDTWQLESQINTNDAGLCATDLAYDRINNICYGAFFTDNQDGWELGIIDFSGEIPVKTTIGRIPLMVAALGVNKSGEIYGICEDGVLYKFDKNTADCTRIGDTGIKVGGYSGVLQQSGEFDQHTDIFYWAAADAYGYSTLYTVDINDAKVTKIADIPDRAQILNMQVMAPKADDKAPGFIRNFKVEFKDGNLLGNVSFSAPEYTYDGSDLTSVTYNISANGETKASERIAAGANVSRKINIEAGQCHLCVQVENGVGLSPMADTIFWAGPDVPVMKEVNYVKNGNASLVSWSINDVGIHGGWVGDVSYKVVRYPDGFVVANSTKETSITDIIPDDAPLDLYSYDVIPTCYGHTGNPLTSNGIVVGNAVQPPYSNTFDDSSSMNLMEVLNVNKDKYTWHWEYDKYESKNGTAKCSTGDSYADSDFDDWMLTPEIKLEAGKTYELSFLARCTEYYYDMYMHVKIGAGTDVSKFKELLPKQNMNFKTSFKEYTATITAEKTETIRIGFHCSGEYVSGAIVIDDIRLSEGVLPTAPGAVTDLAILPDDKGALKASVEFTAPVVDHAGNTLYSLSKIDIYCDNKLAKSLTSVTPGMAVKENVTVENDGEHSFRVETFNNDGAGDPLTLKQFIGVDVPSTFSAWLEEDGTYITLKWDAPTVGEHGKYINPDDLTYNVYYSDGTMIGDLLASGLTGSSYSFQPTPGVDEGEQGMILFAMRAVNRAGESRGISTAPLIVGKPYNLPIEEHFDGTSGLYYDGDTDINFDVAQGASSDGDNNCFVWYVSGNNFDAYKELRTLKLDTKDTSKLRMTFDYRLTSGGRFEIYAIKPDGSRVLAHTADTQSTDDNWNSALVDLSQFSSERYIRVAIRFIPGNNTSYDILYFDNLSIQDAVEKDVNVTLNIPARAVRYGEHALLTAKVSNNGLHNAENYTIIMQVNGKKISEQKGESLAFKKSAEYSSQYEVRPGDPEQLDVKVEVIYAGDENQNNNTAEGIITVGLPKVSAPENLTVQEGSGIHLKWDAPSEFYKEEVLENFESYSPWTITNFGDWELFDADKAKVITLGDAEFPNEGAPQAFTIFNPASIGVPAENIEALPHSGNQYAACFAAKVSPAIERNDDWLISPLLSGEQQTIGFFAKQMIPDYGAEKIEILSSEKGRSPEAFTKVQEFEISNYTKWEHFEVIIPQDALYFAIRVITRDGHLFMLDDVNFIAGSCKEITSWNVYRNNEFIAEVPGTELKYNDPSGNNNCYYNVTAVYATGEESAFSNTAAISGVSDTLDSQNVLYNVYSIDGKILRKNAKNIGSLAPGIYIINGVKTIIRK